MSSSLFSQSVSFTKKVDAPLRLTHASKPPAATKTVRRKKAAGSGSKNSHGTSSSKPSLSLDSGNSKIQEQIMSSTNFQIKFDNFDHSSETMLSSFKFYSLGALTGSSLFSQSDSFKKKAASTKTVGKKAAGSSSKNNHAMSSSKPSLSLDSSNSKIQESIMCSSNLHIKFDNFYHSNETLSSFKLSSPGAPIMGSSLFSQSISFKKKADAPKRLARASKPPAATKTVSGKKAAGNSSKNSRATSSSKPSWSFDSGNSKIQESIMRSFNLQIECIILVTLLKHCCLLLNYLLKVLLV